MKKKTRQTGLLLSVLMLATTSLYPVSAFAEETTEAPAEAVTEAAEKSDAKTMMTGNWAPATRERIQSVIDANADSGRYVVFDFDNTSAIFDVEEALLAYQIENLPVQDRPGRAWRYLETQIPSLDEPVGKNPRRRRCDRSKSGR